MLKKLKIVIASSLAMVLLAAPLALPGVVLAQDADIGGSLCAGSDLKFGDSGSCDAGGSEDKLNTLITNIVNVFSVVVGIVAVIMIIIGGFRYITSGGDSGNVSGAKNTILYAIVGLIVVALAQFIVKFVLSKATDVSS